LSGVFWERANEMTDLAIDPPDSHFRLIARSRPPPVPRVVPGSRVNTAAAAALNPLFASYVSEIGLERAVLTSIERASGAARANQPVWRRRQLQAAHGYAARLSRTLRAQPRLLTSARAALAASSVPSVAVNPPDVKTVQQQVNAGGLSSQLLAVLARLGVNKEKREQIRTTFMSLGPDIVAQIGSFPDALTSPSVTRETGTLAKLFARFSVGR
jgi:hypothetical protein